MALPIPDVEPVTSAFWLLRLSALAEITICRVTISETLVENGIGPSCSHDARLGYSDEQVSKWSRVEDTSVVDDHERHRRLSTRGRASPPRRSTRRERSVGERRIFSCKPA